MEFITDRSARENLAATMDRVCSDRVPIAITRSGQQPAVVLLSLDEFRQIEATAHLLRRPANARRLISAIGSLSPT